MALTGLFRIGITVPVGQAERRPCEHDIMFSRKLAAERDLYSPQFPTYEAPECAGRVLWILASLCSSKPKATPLKEVAVSLF